MQCLICKSADHPVYKCKSNRATTVYDATTNWLNNRLILHYSNKELDIFEISKAYQFERLTQGDLLFLHGSETEYNRESIIYQFIIRTTLELSKTHILYRNIMDVDVIFWTNCISKNTNRLHFLWKIYRENAMKTDEKKITYLHIKSGNPDLQIDCAVCLRDGLKESTCTRLSCAHYLCKTCLPKCVEKSDKCPPM